MVREWLKIIYLLSYLCLDLEVEYFAYTVLSRQAY